MNRKTFIDWIKTQYSYSRGYSHALASSIFIPNEKNKCHLKRATKLYDIFIQQQQEEQQPEQQEESVDTIEKLNTLLNARIKTINSLQEDIRRLIACDKSNKDKIDVLKESSDDMLYELEQQEKEIGQYKKQIENLLQRIEDRTQLIYIRFSDDSAKAYPKTIKFMDMKEQIDASQISSIAVLDVDWSL